MSICNKQLKSIFSQETNTDKGMSIIIGQTEAVHPSINATIEKEPVRIMIDTSASSGYISTEVITKLNLKPIRREQREIKQIYGTMRKIVKIYQVTLDSNVDNNFSLEMECINAEKDILKFLPNPTITVIKVKIPRLRRINFPDEETSSKYVPVHIILGVGAYQIIRTSELPIFGNKLETDPVAENTKLPLTLFGGKIMQKLRINNPYFVPVRGNLNECVPWMFSDLQTQWLIKIFATKTSKIRSSTGRTTLDAKLCTTTS